MVVDPEKTTFGAVVVDRSPTPPLQSTPQRQSLRLKSSQETTDLPSTPLPSTPLSNHSTPGNEPSNPFSAFYTHSPAAESELKAPPVYTHDIESQCNLAVTRSNVEQTKDCTMWPSPAAQKAKARAEKKAKSWNPLTHLGLGKKQKLVAHIVIALFIVGAAVGIGVGVSKAVGGGVWSGPGQTKPIPTTNNNNKSQ